MVKKSITITPYNTPWEVACIIINAEYKHENIFNQEVISPFFNKDDLRRIGEHLMNYCKAESEETK